MWKWIVRSAETYGARYKLKTIHFFFHQPTINHIAFLLQLQWKSVKLFINSHKNAFRVSFYFKMKFYFLDLKSFNVISV